MFARPTPASIFALVLWLALPVVAVAQGFEYAQGTSKYRISSSTKGVQEMMGQTQEAEQSSSQVVTVTVARASKDTLAMTAVLDSIELVGPMGMTPPGLDKLKGMKVTAKLSPFGKFYSSEAPKDSSMTSMSTIAEGLGNFLPRIRGRMATGSTWTDTTSGKVNQGPFELERKVISKFTVVGDTTVGGEKSWKIARESSTSLSGSGAPQGQPATMEGTSNGKATIVVSQKGVFQGSSSEDQAKIKVVLAANGMEIGITQTGSTKIEKLK
jgi:hypothetical protein